jgi:hypothetical protein
LSTTETEVTSFNDAIKDKVPTIGKPESLIVELQRGLMDSTTGLWQTTAEVRELTGEDEEYLASLENDRNMTYAKYINSLLARSTERIGNIHINGNQAILQDLVIGDRDSLFLGVIKATYGPEKTFTRTCASCDKDSDITINLVDDFPLTVPNVDVHKPLEVQLRKGGVVKFRIPTGSDSLQVVKDGSTTAEQSTHMIARCAIWEENAPENPVQWAKSLSLADRTKIIKTLLNVEIGPKIREVNTQCAHCGQDMEIVIDWVSLLLG